MEFHQLRYFLKAAELRNFTQAAAECFISQPSLSQQIIKLEQELGQPLFERSARGVELTESGKLLRSRAEQIVTLVDQARREITDDGETGQLAIGAIPTIAPYFLPEIVRRFREAVPRVTLKVHEDVTEQCLKKVQTGEWDLAIVALPVRIEHLEVEPLFDEDLWLAVPPGHRLAGMAEVSFEELEHENLLLLGEAHCLTEHVAQYCRKQDAAPLETGRLAQLTTIQELVSRGQGVSFIPNMCKTADSQRDSRRDSQRNSGTGCVYLPLQGERPQRTIALVWNSYRYQTQLLKRALEFIRQWPSAR